MSKSNRDFVDMFDDIIGNPESERLCGYAIVLIRISVAIIGLFFAADGDIRAPLWSRALRNVYKRQEGATPGGP